MQSRQSDNLLKEAMNYIPGGVNSPVRAFKAVEGNPPFITRSEGCWLWDEDGNRFLDLIGSWGPMIVGHAHPQVQEAILQAAQRGTSFGAPTKREVDFAKSLCQSHPALDMVRLCSSGTEATMHAIRLARGFTGRNGLVKVNGCYHGAHDSVLVKAGSGVATFAQPGSPGIPAPVANLTRVVEFNDLIAVEENLKSNDIAAVILEAVPGNMGCIIPAEGYLQGLERLCQQYGALLIVDEVMTGFRLSLGGACEFYGIKPDLVALGKIVGGGLPLAAFGGRREVMEYLSPVGAVYQAGTLSGNPLAVAAGQATLDLLDSVFYDNLEKTAATIEANVRPIVEANGCSFSRVGSMFTIFFCETAPENFQDVLKCDFGGFGRFHRYALEAGLYFPPSQYEAVFLSAAIGSAEIEFLVDGIRQAFSRL